MAEDQDQSQKTEEPTQRRLQQGRDKGQVAVSQEVKSWAALAVAALALLFMIPAAARHLAIMARGFLENANAIRIDEESARAGFSELVFGVMWDVAPFFGLMMVAALLGSIGQIGLLWAPEKIQPTLDKISLLKGAKRLFSLRSLVEFGKGVAKLTAVGALAFGLSLPLIEDVELLPSMGIFDILDRIQAASVRMTAGTAAIMTVIAIVDFLYQRHAFLQQMRMTKQDVKDEYKQAEGDPHVKAKIRQLRMERSRRRMMAAVPNADVVVTNPTHFAVALEYKMESMTAPRVIAKGADAVAKRIREVARENDVPVVENPPLARALFAAVDLDQEVPAEHYQAVAQVISYVMRLKGHIPAA